MHLLVRLLINAAALWAATRLVPGISFTGDWRLLLVVALVFGTLNVLVRPVLKLLTLPILIVTLGLFIFVLNAFMLWLTGAVSDAFALGFHVAGFGPAFLGALVVSVVSFALSLFLMPSKEPSKHTRHAAIFIACLLPASLGSAPNVTIERLDPRFDRLVPRDAVVEPIADGLDWVEGPVWRSRTGDLLFSNIPKNAIMRWQREAGLSVFLQPSGYSGSAPFTGPEPGSNGLTLDAEGRLILCEHGDRRVTRLEAGGKRTVLADRYEGKRLNSPNDVVHGPDGALYFTDPPYGLPKRWDDPEKELPFQGVYRRAPDGTLTVLVRDLRAPNGIGFSPDGRTMYVAQSDPANAIWMAYEVTEGGRVGRGRVFASAQKYVPHRPGLPDGLKIDRAGNLFATGPGGVLVFAPDGTHLGSILFNQPTGNCAWGEDGSTLFITSNKSVYRVRLATSGPLPGVAPSSR